MIRSSLQVALTGAFVALFLGGCSSPEPTRLARKDSATVTQAAPVRSKASSHEAAAATPSATPTSAPASTASPFPSLPVDVSFPNIPALPLGLPPVPTAFPKELPFPMPAIPSATPFPQTVPPPAAPSAK
jgi:hypothetical protein